MKYMSSSILITIVAETNLEVMKGDIDIAYLNVYMY